MILSERIEASRSSPFRFLALGRFGQQTLTSTTTIFEGGVSVDAHRIYYDDRMPGGQSLSREGADRRGMGGGVTGNAPGNRSALLIEHA